LHLKLQLSKARKSFPEVAGGEQCSVAARDGLIYKAYNELQLKRHVMNVAPLDGYLFTA
jgi:hypothetical protein